MASQFVTKVSWNSPHDATAMFTNVRRALALRLRSFDAIHMPEEERSRPAQSPVINSSKEDLVNDDAR